MKSIYVLLINTGSIPSKAVRLFTHYKYSHVALSLDASFTKLYSFGRKKVNNFLKGGFTTYGIDSEFYKKFYRSTCLILETKVPLVKYNKLKRELSDFEKHPDKYKYDFGGYLLRLIPHYNFSRKYHFVCSQFVASVLEDAEIIDFEKPTERIRPKDFTKLLDLDKIYEGNISEYSEIDIKK